MPTLEAGNVTVGTAVTQLLAPKSNPVHVLFRNNDNTKDVRIGDTDVTATHGLVLAKLDKIDFVLQPGLSLWAITSTGTAEVSYLWQLL
jgi:hypothetical protein